MVGKRFDAASIAQVGEIEHEIILPEWACSECKTGFYFAWGEYVAGSANEGPKFCPHCGKKNANEK